MTRRSAKTGRNRRPGPPSIVRAAGQQWAEDGGPQPSNPYSVALLAIWERRIAEGDMPTGAKLADLLSANGPGALPRWLFDHLCCHLRGEIRRKLGPKAGFELSELVVIAAVQRYGELLAWLQKRNRSQGLNGWSCIREAEWWRGPPHERAKRMIRRRSARFGRIDIARLANILSSRK